MASTVASAEWSASVRKKTYTRWINAYCRHSLMKAEFDEVKDIFSDLRNGIILCSIMGHYYSTDLVKHSTKHGPLERKQKIENVEQVILEVNYDGVHRFSKHPDLIVDGDEEATLELVWWVIFIVQLSIDDNSEGDQSDEVDPLDEVQIRKEMLHWVQEGVKPHALEVTDFSTSWSDGKAFCAVIYAYNAETFSYSEVEGKETKVRLEHAFQFAEKIVLVERLLDVEDVAVPVPDEKCILIYLSLLRQKLVFKPEELTMAKVVLQIWEQVSAMGQKDLPCLKDKLGNWGPPARNTVILRQFDQLKELQPEFDQFGRKIAELEKRMKWTNQQQLKYDFEELKDMFMRDKKTFDHVMMATESCCAPVKEFEKLMSAEGSVTSWLYEAIGDVESLLDLANDEARHDEARESLLSIQQAAVGRWQDVDKLLCLAAEFAETRQKVVDILVEYQKTQPKHVPTSSNEGGSSLEEQASKVLQDWEWILNQCITVLQEWFMMVFTWKLDEDFTSRKETREVFLHNCNSLFEMLIQIPRKCTRTRSLNLDALTKKKEEANNHWTLLKLCELNHWVKGCLDDLSYQRPLAENLEGVKIQKQWYQKFLQQVSDREPEVLRYETLHLTVSNEPQEVLKVNEIEKEHQLLGGHWKKLEEKRDSWGMLLDSCETAWESCHATDGVLCSLEEVHAHWEPPAENQDILAQLKEIETFQTSRVVPFKCEVSAMTDLVANLKSLGGHPPVEELCWCVTERYDRLVSSLDKLCAATQTCYQVVHEFERVKEPFVSWLTPAVDEVKALFPVPQEKGSRDNARTALCAVQKEARDRENHVEALRQLAHTFQESREILIKTMPSHTALAAPASTKPSLRAQADHLYEQWRYILERLIGYPEVVTFHPTVNTLNVGHDFSLVVYTKDAGEGMLTAVVQGEVSGHIDCTVKRNDCDSDIWLVTFRVLKLEKYTIQLFWSGTEIPRSPLHILPPDPSTVKVEGPLMRDMSVLFICDIADAGYGELLANCRSSRFGNVKTEVANVPNGKVEVFFVPPGKDQFSLSILWDGIHIPGSPFDINLNQPDASRVKVDGPHPCAEGIGPVHTFIDTTEAGDGHLDVKCIASDGDDIPVRVVNEEQPGHFAAVFETSKPGTYNVHVTFSGKPVPNSPFSLSVKAVEVFDINRVVVSGFEEGLRVVGEAVSFIVDCSQAGCMEQPKVTSETPKGKGKKKQGKKEIIQLSERDSDWGVFEGTYTPMNPGRHKIHVQISGISHPNSPFIVTATAQEGKPSIVNPSVYLFGCSDTIVNLNLALPWTVSKVSGYAKLHPSDDELPVTVKKTTDPGQFRCSFWPSGPGVYTLHVHDSKTKNHIVGSPFEVIVLEPTAPRYGHALFQTHRAALKLILHTDDMLSASCTGKAVGPVKADVGQKPDNTSWVQIRLKEPDLYTVEVKTGSKQFPGSPFSFRVLPPLTYDDPACVVPGTPTDPIKLGQRYTLTVLTRGAGDGELTAKVEGSKSGAVPCKIYQVEKEKWEVSFLVERPEVYMVYLYWSGAEVPNTPVKVFPADAAKCRFHHLPSEEDKLLTHKDIVYYVDATEAGYGELTIECEGPSLTTQPSRVTITPSCDNQDDFEVVYTPTAPGTHKHSVYWSGEAIPHSPLTFKVVDEEEEGASQLYSEAKEKLDKFFAATEPQLQRIDVSIHTQPEGGDQVSPKRKQQKLQLDVLPVILLQQLEVISKEKAAVQPYYETFMREGQKLSKTSSAKDVRKQVEQETEQYHTRWLQVVRLLSGLDRECQNLQMRFQTFLDNMLALALWLYDAWSRLMPNEDIPLQVTSTGNGDGPGKQWSSVKAAEESLPLQKCKVASLQEDGAIWACLPLLHESYCGRFLKAFVEDVSTSQHTSPPLFHDGICTLQQKLSDLEQLIAIFRLIWDASHNLDVILKWITSREAHYCTCLSTVPTQDTHTGRERLQELKHLAQDLSDKVKEKETALAEAQLAVQKAGPTRGKEVSKRVDAIVVAWTRVHDGCKKVKSVLQEYLPEMESLWDRIEQCEKCLDGMDGSGTSDQVDSTSHSNTLKMTAHTMSDVSQSVKSIRAQWNQLTKSYPSLKDVVPSVNDPSGMPAFDAEGRIRAMEKRLKEGEDDLQKFKDDLQRLLKWFQWARDATIPEARADFSLTSLMEQLQELADFKVTLVEKQSEIPPLQTRAEHLSQSDMVLPLLRLSTEVEAKCTSRKQFLENLISRWKAFLATAEALLNWTKKMRERLCEVIADKDSCGVEDHLATCKDLKESITKKAVEFGQFQGNATSLEIEVKGQGWDIEVVTAKNAEVQQSRVSLSDFIDKTQAELQAVADRLKALQLIVTEKQSWLKDVSKRLLPWRPCFGDVRIVKSELDVAEGLLAEAHTHDDAIEQLADNVDFVVEHSRQRERKRIKEAIMDVHQRHADLKQHLQDKVSQCQNALPLWQSFAATTSDLTSWMEEKEKFLSSPPMQPTLSSDEEDGTAECIKSVQNELVDDKLQLLKPLEADLTKVWGMEKDRAYIAKRCADLRRQFDHLVKMARDALALCIICKSVRQLQHCIQQHRSLPSPSALPGPELEKRHKGLLDDSTSLVQQTQNALKKLRKAVQAAQKGGATILPEIQQAVDTVTADAEQLPVAAKSWREELTSRYNAWTQFREGLEQYIHCATDLHTRVENEIDAQPIGVFLKDLDAFRNELESMIAQTKAAQKGLPPLRKSADVFLFGDGQPVIELRDAFTLAIQQQEETAATLHAYLNRIASWEEFFDLLDKALGWFNPFKQVAESDIEEFLKEEESQNKPIRMKLKEHISVMDAKCGMVYHIRDFPLPILDIQSEKESVQDIVHQRDVFVDEFEQLREKLKAVLRQPYTPPPPARPCITCRQLLLLLLLFLLFISVCSYLVLSWLQSTCTSCSGFMYYITASHEHQPI